MKTIMKNKSKDSKTAYNLTNRKKVIATKITILYVCQNNGSYAESVYSKDISEA